MTVGIAAKVFPALVITAISLPCAQPASCRDDEHYHDEPVYGEEDLVECGLLPVDPENDSGNDCGADPCRYQWAKAAAVKDFEATGVRHA
jgi:hypothetical protein